MAYDVKANWQQIDVEDLSPATFKAYNEYKRIYREMKAARETFEATMTSEAKLALTDKLVFGYNFGKLSCAIVPNDKPVAAKAKGALSLSAFLASQRASGART